MALTGSLAHENQLEERKLGRGWNRGKKFEKYMSIYDRCCVPEFEGGGDKGECKCPVRTYEGIWGWYNYYAKWEKKCPTTILKKSSVAAFAASDDNFSTLVSALKQAELASTLAGEGAFTVFAPTNDAFEEIADVVAGLDTDQLTKVLLYHVVPGTVTSDQLSDGSVGTLLDDATVMIDVEPGSVTVNGAIVSSADNLASNGVVHIIDAVLIPPGL